MLCQWQHEDKKSGGKIMSMIGEFGLCKKASYIILQEAAAHGSQKKFDEAAGKVQEEME